MDIRSGIGLNLLALLVSCLGPSSSGAVELSPNAASMVETVAAAMLGHVEFVHERDQGTSSFSRGLRSLTAACVQPGTTDPSEEARIKREASERELLGSQIAPIADLDSSGSVSDEEAVQFRMAVETVLMARALSEELRQPVTISQLAEAAGSSEATVERRIALYRNIQPKLTPMSPGSPMGLSLAPLSSTILQDQ